MAKSRQLLTRKREAWAAKRGQATFEGKPLAPPVGVSAQYADKLTRLATGMVETYRKEIEALFRSEAGGAHFAQDATIASQSRILLNNLNARFGELFAEKAKPTAENMVGAAEKASKSSLYSSLEKLSGGLSMKVDQTNAVLMNVRKASIVENVNLIKSIASQYFDQVSGAVMRSITTGNGLQDLVPALMRYEGITKRRATNIALDQTRKVYSSTNKARMQAIGIKKFRWNHSHGGHNPRPDHEEMDGNVYSFDNLPVIDQRTGERGIPGQAPNCKCFMTPVFDFEGVSDDDSSES